MRASLQGKASPLLLRMTVTTQLLLIQQMPCDDGPCLPDNQHHVTGLPMTEGDENSSQDETDDDDDSSSSSTEVEISLKTHMLDVVI